MDEEAIQDLFAGLGPVRIRRMFGGKGIYAGERIFAIEAGGEIYLKADAESVPLFEAAGSRPFTYDREGRSATMSYWLMPDGALDDPDEAARWGRAALDASRRAGEAPGGKRSKRSRPKLDP